MITQHAWMFLSSFEKLRAKLLLKDAVNMVHLGPRAFEEIGGEVVQTTSFVLRNSNIADYKGTYCRLIEPTTQQGKEDMFLARENRYTAQQSNFSKIPGSPVVYWISEQLLSIFEASPALSELSEPKVGLQSGNSEKYFRLWQEVSFSRISFSSDPDYKWFPCVKGGEARKWYGNNASIINWSNNGAEIRNEPSAVIRNPNYYFHQGLTWTKITSIFALRYFPANMILSDSSVYVFPQEWEYTLGCLNSKIAPLIVGLLNPTLNFVATTVGAIPIVQSNDIHVKSHVLDSIKISKEDWDSYETSWDFQRHPLIRSVSRLTDAYAAWKDECEQRFLQLKTNEEELNRIFIVIYGLQDELTPDVADKDVTVHRVFDTKDDVPQSMQGSNYVRTKRDEIVSLLSYAVGCMFGRYSLDVDGLAYAGGDWDDGKYKTFLPDRDGILPITDEEYLEDDIISRLCDWLKAAYGADTLEENLDFIAEALGGKGNSSREIIRSYFLKEFFKDHCKTYQKRPIYWLFDSGKQNGFKALIYLHRYTPDTIGNLRVDYLHKMQRVYESEINRMQDMIDHSTNAREVAASTKRKEKLQKQLKECRDYDEMIAHLALSRIELDLDDGVKVNYEKIQTASDGKKYAVLAKI